MTTTTKPKRLLFVCLGNICRSPLAEGIFLDLARRRKVEKKFEVESCGLGSWHVGNPPDPRSIAVAARHNIDLTSRARQFDARRDAEAWDLLLAMDRDNSSGLIAAGAPSDRVRLMRSFDPSMADRPEHELDVPDPYMGGPEGFDHVYTMLERACAGLLDHMLDT